MLEVTTLYHHFRLFASRKLRYTSRRPPLYILSTLTKGVVGGRGSSQKNTPGQLRGGVGDNPVIAPLSEDFLSQKPSRERGSW